MNPIERVIRKVDAAQRHYGPTAFVFGVVKKFGDDNGGVLVGNLTYSAFVALFPLLLVLVTILGLVAALNPVIRHDVLGTVAGQVPLIGRTLTGNVHQLRRSSVIGLIVGLLALIWGSTGLAQAGLFTMEQVWNLPGPARPGYVQRLGRAMLFLALLGAGVIVTTGLAGLNTYGRKAFILVIFAEVAAAVVNVAMYLGAFRVLTPKVVPARRLLPGAVVGGIAWTILQIVGTYLVHHFLHSDTAYGVFATVLGLLAWIYLAVRIIVYCAEINVVLARRLWPRAIVQPPLTEADRASMALQALQNQRRAEQQVRVTFDDRKPGIAAPRSTPQTPDEVVLPGQDQSGDSPGQGPSADSAAQPADAATTVTTPNQAEGPDAEHTGGTLNAPA
jgi:YihY family inner membrane protein